MVSNILILFPEAEYSRDIEHNFEHLQICICD
jgi:hypothetical protein